MSDDDRLHCSFCGKHQREVAKLIAGPVVYICNECVSVLAPQIGIRRLEADAGKTRLCALCSLPIPAERRVPLQPNTVLCLPCFIAVGKCRPRPKPPVQSRRAADEPTCSFCGKYRDEVIHFFSGPTDVNICNECIDLCVDIIAEENADRKKENLGIPLTGIGHCIGCDRDVDMTVAVPDVFEGEFLCVDCSNLLEERRRQ